MQRFILRRLLSMPLVMVAITALIFGLSQQAGDPRYLYLSPYTKMSPAEWEAIGRSMGLDRPLVVRYWLWLSKAARGDFGESIAYHVNSLDLIKRSLRATLELAAVSFAFSMGIGIPLGVLSAVSRGSIWDYVARSFALLGQSVPPFWLAIVMILVFAVELGWLPTSRRGGWTHYVLPVVTLGWVASAPLLRLTRSSMLEVLDSEYVKFARAKGVGAWATIWKHAFRNALVTPLTYAAILMASFITGAVVIETVFAWPGIGRLSVQAALNNDFPLITGLALFFSGLFLLASLLSDIAYAAIDPRIRYT
ncbi:MAG: ABC transporter permease [Chloroflexota bacterium]|nr:ABC transporter permease [Chloroflexota bacterium]